MAQNPRVARFDGSNGHVTTATSRAPCNLNSVGGPITFGNMVMGNSNSPLGIGETIYLCFNDSFAINDIGMGAVFDGDPDPTTRPGVGLAIYDCKPTVDGSTFDAVAADCFTTLLPSTNGIDVSIDFDEPYGGSTVFRNNIQPNIGQSFQDAINSGQPFQWWFAPITFDSLIAGIDPFYEGNADCVTVDTSQAFSVVYLNPITRVNDNVVYPFGGKGDEARFSITGGLPEFDDTQNYTFEVVNVNDPSITGSINNGLIGNGDFPIVKVPSPGTYRVTATDGRGCPLTFEIEMNDFMPTTNDIEIKIESPPVAVIGDEFCIDITTENFDSIIGGEFFVCWDTAVLDFTRTDNVIDGAWLIGESLQDDPGAIVVQFFGTNIFAGLTYPDGTTLFSMCFIPIAKDDDGLTRVTYCEGDPRPGSFNMPELVLAEGGGTPIPFPNDPANDGQDILITDPDAAVVTLNPMDACPGEDNGQINFNIIGGGPMYQIALEGEKIDGPINLSEAGDTSFSDLPPGDYTLLITESDKPGTFERETFTIEVANLVANADESSPVTCNGDSDGAMSVEVIKNGIPESNLDDYSFLWISETGDTISTDQVVTGLPSARYTAIVTDPNGCRVDDTETLTQTNPLEPVLNIIRQPTCSGTMDGNIAVRSDVGGGLPPYDVVWSNGVNGLANPGIPEDKYLYTVTDGNGCTTIDSVELTADVSINLNPIKTDILCFDDANGELTLTATISNWSFPMAPPSQNGYIFNWSANSPILMETGNRSLLDSLDEGDYTVTVTHPELPVGCMATHTFSFTNPPELIIESLDITPLSSCSLPVPDGEITATVIGGSPNIDYQYVWSDTSGMTLQNTQTATNLDAGPITLNVNDANGCNATLDTIVGTPPPPDIQFFEDDNVNCATDLGDLNIIAGPTRPGFPAEDFIYQWSHDGSETDAIASNLPPGIYYVTVADSDNCGTVDSAAIIAPAPITADTTMFVEPCFATSEGAINVLISGGTPVPGADLYEFEWRAENETEVIATIPTLDQVESGNYMLKVTDENGCEFDTLISLNNIPRIVVGFDMASLTGVQCFDQPANQCDGTAIATANYEGGAPGAFTFTWQATNETVTATDMTTSNSLCAGMQALLVSDGQCEVVDSVDIPSPDRLEFDVANSSISPAACFGDANGTANIAAIGGTPTPNGNYTFTWPDTDVTDRKTDLAAAIYVITITDSNGCIATHNLEISQPDAALTASIDAANTNNVICPGDADGLITVLVAGGNQGTNNFVWTNNVSNSESAAGLSPGTYTIDVMDSEGCMASTMYEVIEPTPISAQIDWDPIQCNGYSTSIRISSPTGGNGNSYTFAVDGSTPRSANEVISAFGGDRLVSIFDATGCQVDMMVSVNQPAPLNVFFEESVVEVDLGSDITLDLRIESDASANEIFWTENGGPVDTSFLCSFSPCRDPTVKPLENTTYTAFVTDANGCMEEAEVKVDVDKNRNVYIPNVFAPNNTGFDTNDRFQIFTGSGVKSVNFVKVFNRWGTLVAEVGRTDINGGTHTIDIWDGFLKGQKANQGVYIYIAEVEFIDIQPGGGNTKLLYRGDITLLR